MARPIVDDDAIGMLRARYPDLKKLPIGDLIALHIKKTCQPTTGASNAQLIRDNAIDHAPTISEPESNDDCTDEDTETDTEDLLDTDSLF